MSTVTERRIYNWSDHEKITKINGGGIKAEKTDKFIKDFSKQVDRGGSVPDWRKRIANCQSATTTLTGTSHTVKMYSGYAWVRQIVTGDLCLQEIDGDIMSSVTIAPTQGNTIDGVADNMARSRVLANYLNMVNTWRGGNFLAEIRETIHMVRHPLESFYRHTWSFAQNVRGLGKVYKRNPVNYGKALANAWLAYAFGAKPLVQDINDAAKALNVLGGSGRFDVRPLKGYGIRTIGSAAIGHPLTVPISFSILVSTLNRTNLTVRYYGAIKTSPPGARADLQTMGLDVFDIVPAVWEAIPWSFFIDYFANVQEVLDGFRLWDVQVGWFNRTVRNSSATTWIGMYADYPANLPHGGDGGRSYCSTVQVVRTASSLPHPNWHFQMPGFPSLRWLNIAALARQCLGSNPRLGRV